MKNKNEMKIKAVSLSSSLTVQELIDASKRNKINIFDLDAIKDELQLELAFFHAKSAFEDGENIGKDMLMEVMIRSAGTRQISDAIKKVGVKNPKRIVVAYNTAKVKLTESQIKSALNAKKITWKQSNSEKEIRQMVQIELED